MSLNNPKPGWGCVSEYQISALPWVSSSNVSGVYDITLPFVANFFTIMNTGTTLMKVGFTQNGVMGTNYFPLPVSGSYTANMRITKLFVSGTGASMTLVAGLTSIPYDQMPVITGSNNFQGVG